MNKANANRAEIQAIRTRYLRGHITYSQARKEMTPIIDGMNQRGREIAKQYGFQYKPITFTGLMR